jgi:hypothetical protein
MIYKVIMHCTTVAETLVRADSLEQAIEIANDNDCFCDTKEEVVNTDYTAEAIGNDHPQGRIVNTKDGYIDAEQIYHEI